MFDLSNFLTTLSRDLSKQNRFIPSLLNYKRIRQKSHVQGNGLFIYIGSYIFMQAFGDVAYPQMMPNLPPPEQKHHDRLQEVLLFRDLQGQPLPLIKQKNPNPKLLKPSNKKSQD